MSMFEIVLGRGDDKQKKLDLSRVCQHCQLLSPHGAMCAGGPGRCGERYLFCSVRECVGTLRAAFRNAADLSARNVASEDRAV